MSFLNPSLYSEFVSYLARKRGYRFAEKEIASIIKLRIPLAEIEHRREATPLKDELNHRTHDPNSFKGGWWDRWRKLGETDATDGVCRSLKFSNDAYDIGWFSMILHRKKQGWENDRVTDDFDRLHRYFSGPKS